mmetsp:Transcript_20135/g.43293  ORF Transcript_20135/g.43293 Transcript_20135/m.43293 type:complete len:269 (-) Transcript_20135:410-1216(-)
MGQEGLRSALSPRVGKDECGDSLHHGAGIRLRAAAGSAGVEKVMCTRDVPVSVSTAHILCRPLVRCACTQNQIILRAAHKHDRDADIAQVSTARLCGRNAQWDHLLNGKDEGHRICLPHLSKTVNRRSRTHAGVLVGKCSIIPPKCSLEVLCTAGFKAAIIHKPREHLSIARRAVDEGKLIVKGRGQLLQFIRIWPRTHEPLECIGVWHCEASVREQSACGRQPSNIPSKVGAVVMANQVKGLQLKRVSYGEHVGHHVRVRIELGVIR